MSAHITSEQLERLDTALGRQIRALESLRPQLSLVDTEVLKAGLDLFEDEDALVPWLVEPAASLGNEIPLRLMGAEEGRQLVAKALRRILHGVY